VGKLAVERHQDRTFASLNGSDPTAVFEKDFLLFDNIGGLRPVGAARAAVPHAGGAE
jgi:hypothetical protein